MYANWWTVYAFGQPVASFKYKSEAEGHMNALRDIYGEVKGMESAFEIRQNSVE